MEAMLQKKKDDHHKNLQEKLNKLNNLKSKQKEGNSTPDDIEELKRQIAELENELKDAVAELEKSRQQIIAIENKKKMTRRGRTCPLNRGL